MTRTKNGNLLVIKSRGVIETVCFIILNYNGFGETKQLVDSIRVWNRELLDFHVIVVDNCSPDGSYEKLRIEFAHSDVVDVICSEKNGGYSYGNNYGIKFAIENYEPEYLAIANPDIEVDENTVIQLLETFKNERIAMVSPVMKSVNGECRLVSYKLPSFFDDLRACWKDTDPKNVVYSGFPTITGEPNLILTEMLPGSFFVVRTSAFQEANLFDERVFLFCEERIIGKRMKQLGYSLAFRKDLSYVHAHSVTIRRAMDTVKIWKTIWSSRFYYQVAYNHIGAAKQLLLLINSKIFILRLMVALMLHEWKTRITGESF